MKLWQLLGIALCAGTIALYGCGDNGNSPTTAASGGGGAAKKKIMLGVVAKSVSNPVFQAAHQGAKDAAKELGGKYNADIEINIQTPTDESPEKQVEGIENLVRLGAAGIAVSCSEAGKLTSAIDAAVAKGVPVMCFDSDAPASKRFAFYGTDDMTCGALTMSKLATEMGDKGVVAILAGNQAAPNLQNRVKGAEAELAKHPNMKELSTGPVYHEETAEKAAQRVQEMQRQHPEITGWCFIGGWPLFTRDALPWKPGEIKVVSVDALPAQLSYLTSGHVQVLLAQDCYGWGHKSVEILLEKIEDKKDPAQVKILDPLYEVNKTNLADFSKKWDKWLGK